MLTTEAVRNVEAWARRSATGRVSRSHVAELACDVTARLNQYCMQRSELAELIEAGGKSAERYVSRATINAAADRHTAADRRSRAERRAAGGTPGSSKRPGVLRSSSSLAVPDTAEAIVNRMVVDQAIQLTHVLPRRQRSYFMMFQDGMSPSEISRVCGVSRQAVSQSLKDAFKTIRVGLGEIE